jgi:hypothetical protein
LECDAEPEPEPELLELLELAAAEGVVELPAEADPPPPDEAAGELLHPVNAAATASEQQAATTNCREVRPDIADLPVGSAALVAHGSLSQLRGGGDDIGN